MPQLSGVDQDVCENSNRGLVLGVGFEQLGGLFDALVVAREGGLDEFGDLSGV
jgi:hypothetical protein